MTQDFTPNRWNWSEKDGKWVYVELTKNGQKKFYYQLDPPKKFIELSMKIKEINAKMIATENQKKNLRLFKKLMKISQKMQNMTSYD
jgi:hypothetical protein